MVVPELSLDTYRRASRKLCELSFPEKLDIVYRVCIKFQPVKDIAYLFRVSVTVVRSLVKKAEKNLSFLSELNELQLRKIKEKEQVKTTAEKLYLSNRSIDKADDVVQAVKKEHKLVITRQFARTVMKQDLGLSYRAIKRIAYRANSPRSLILRK